VLRLVNEVPAALWAIVELNLWVMVASIPSLRLLILKTIRDRGERSSASRSRSYTYGSGSKKSIKHRLWPSKGHSSAQSDGRVPLDGDQTTMAIGAHSLPSVDKSDVQLSAPATREPGWTPLGVAEDGEDSIQLQELGGIRVDREIEISRPKNAYHQM